MSWRSLAAACLAASYPLLMHTAIMWDLPWLRAVALALLAMLLLIVPDPASGARWLTFILILAAIAAAYLFGGTTLLAFLPPLVLHGLFAFVFARTLLPGREPLVTFIGRRAKGELPPAMVRYTRHVTQLWAVCLTVLTLISATLPWISVAAWSLATNVLNYILFALIFVAEFLYRRSRFPDHDHPSFVDYVRIVLRADIKNA